MALDPSAKSSNVKRFPKGTVLVKENDDTVKELYILLQGNVGLYKNFRLAGETQTDVLSQGSFYGEMALFLGKSHEYSVVALSDVIALAINRRNVSDFFSSQPDMALTFIEGICKRLAAANEKLNSLQKDSGAKTLSERSSLFPEGHGNYLLPLNNKNDAMLYEQKITCPLCGQLFGNMTIIQSRLKLERTDPDLRQHYKDVEPLHYDIVTCPSCFLSATADAFPGVSKRWQEDIDRKIGPHKLEMYIRTGADRDTFTVFAGYHLAILCASVCFDNYQLITGSLWQKLSRLYKDCEDEKMFLYASEKALEEYLYAYEQFNIPEKTVPQLCFIIGDLYSRKQDYDSARNYFFMIKQNAASTPILKRQAEMRTEEIREIKAAMKTQ